MIDKTERRYALRLKDDFAVRDVIVVLHDVFVRLRSEYNRLQQLHESAQFTSHLSSKDSVIGSCVHVLEQLREQLAILVRRVIRHKDWEFAAPSPISKGKISLFTGMLFYIHQDPRTGHGQMSLQIVLLSQPGDDRTTVVFEW